eukprot:RCo020265
MSSPLLLPLRTVGLLLLVCGLALFLADRLRPSPTASSDSSASGAKPSMPATAVPWDKSKHEELPGWAKELARPPVSPAEVPTAEIARWMKRLCPGASGKAERPWFPHDERGLLSARQICESRVRKLLSDFSPYPTIKPRAARLAYRNFLRPSGVSEGRFEGYTWSQDGVRIRIHNGTLFFRPMPPDREMSILSPRSMQAMCEGTLAFLTKTINKFHGYMPDVDFTVLFGDVPAARHETVRFDDWQGAVRRRDGNAVEAITAEPMAPVFAHASRANTDAVAMPTYDWNWITQDFSPDSTWRADKLNPGPPVWPEKRRQAVWRGAPTSVPRLRACEFSLDVPMVLDAKLAGSADTATHCTWVYWGNHSKCLQMLGHPLAPEVLLQHKYVLDIDGWGTTFRMKNLLLSNSLLVKVEDDLWQFFTGELLPGLHYLPVRRDFLEEDLLTKLYWAWEHDQDAEHIANTATQYVYQHLTEDHAMWYQWAALQIYAWRQSFQMEPPPEGLAKAFHGTTSEPYAGGGPWHGFRPFCCDMLVYAYNRRNCVDLCQEGSILDAFQRSQGH